ncbi:MAG: hypothetical protein L6W00_05835 [Lentisphaeria bacterium]|nr:MAG: hypothetical protein L6W00_05835 [Lentisphaeria bacterium]
MIIKKFNTMFHKHSRWLFGAFTIVIIVSFMGFLTPGQFGLDMFSDPANTRVGTAFGEPVTYGELITEAERLQLFNQIFYGGLFARSQSGAGVRTILHGAGGETDGVGRQ